VVLANPLFEQGSALNGFTPEGLRLLRVLYMHTGTGYSANAQDNSINLGWEALQAPGINTRKALQAELDRFGSTAMQLQFSPTIIYAAGPSHPTTLREVDAARERGCQIQLVFRIRGNLPMTGQDRDRLESALQAANIPAGVYGPLEEDVYLLGVVIYMPHKTQDKRNPWDLASSVQPIARRVIV